MKPMKKALKALFNPDAPSFVDTAARLSAALAEQDQVTRQYEHALNLERPAAEAVRAADNLLRGLRAPEHNDARGRARYEDAQADKARAIEERERIGAEVRRLRQRLDDLAGDIESLRAGGTVEELRAYQGEREATAAELARLDALIATQQAIVDGAAVDSAALDALRAQRPALLADIAEGEDRAAELAALDADIAKAAAALDAEHAARTAAVTDARHTIAGLSVRRAPIAERLAVLDSAAAEWRRKYLLSEAQASASRYQAAAGELAAEYQRLHALGDLLAGQGFADLRMFARPGFTGGKCGRLEVPRLADTVHATVPPAPAGMGHREVPYAWLFTNELMPDVLAQVVAAELDRARDQGVTLFDA